jgi:hypothetical protein
MHRSRSLLGQALRAAIVVTIVAVLMTTVIDIGASGFYATFCSFALLVLADFGGAPLQRLLAYVGTGIAGMALIMIGAFVAQQLVLALIVTSLVTGILAYSVLLRGYVGTAYVPLLLTYVMAGSNLTNEKIAETLEFPRFFGRADRI